MLNSLNYQLSQLGIQLNANDSELEEKIIYIHRNTGWLNTGQYDKKFDTNQTSQQITYNPNNNPRQPNTMQHQTPNTNPRKTEDNIEKWSFVHDQNNQADNSIYYTPASSYEQLHSSQYKTSFSTPTNDFWLLIYLNLISISMVVFALFILLNTRSYVQYLYPIKY